MRGVAANSRSLREILRCPQLGRAGHKIDQLAVQKVVALMRKDLVTRPENPPAYNPESNGSAEKAVQDVSEQVRSLKLALEARIGVSIGDTSAVMEWIVEHAAYVLSRFSVGHDGVTPYKRLTGRKWKRAMVELGEVVLAKFASRKLE